jgi:GntR family transcriptional regulator
MRIQPGSDIPIFQQIAAAMRADIAAGVYRAGDPIPSIRAHSTALLINPNTIKRAYDELEREGLIESRAGLGMFVTDRGAHAARDRTERAVGSAFAQGIRLARAAELPKARVDAAYERAWSDRGERDKP